MNRHFKSVAQFGTAALCFAALTSTVQAATPSSADANAEVLQTISHSVLLDMNFGKVAANGAGGVMVLDPNGSRSCDSTLVCTGGFGLSQLQLSGSDANIAVNFDPTFELIGPGDPIVAEPLFPGGPGAVIHLTGGTAVAFFGARITFGAGQMPGIYSGNFTVNLEYQ